MTAPTTTAPTPDEHPRQDSDADTSPASPGSPQLPATGDPFDQDDLPTPPGATAACRAPCSLR